MVSWLLSIPFEIGAGAAGANGRAKGAARLRARSMTLRFGHLPALGGPVLYKSISSACGALVMICSRGCKARMVTK